jgi:hypothetical protein
MSKNVMLVLGFILFAFGFISFILSLVGLHLDVLAWLHSMGAGARLLVQLAMVFGGVALLYVGKTKDRKDF